jgi:glycosyltransferase involved in cell wall biosynthesis
VRILKVTQAYFPFEQRGGPALKVRSIARMLRRLGHEVAVVSADLGFGPREIAAGSVQVGPQGWKSNVDGIDVIYFKTRAHYRNATINPGLFSFCRRRLKDFDIVHIYGIYDTLGPAVARYCRKFEIPYFVEPLGMTRPIDRGFLLKKLWWRIFRDYLPGATQVVATSEMERAELLADSFASDRVLLRYNGIEPEEFRQLPPPGAFCEQVGINEGERFILFLGRLIPRKGADLLIQAIHLLGGDKTKLVLAGPEGESGWVASLRAKAQALGVDRRVLFAGPLYGEDKKAAMADAWVFALPSRYENFGNAAAEAIACGTPAIVSDRCGIAPLIDQRAGLVTSYDSAVLAQTLKTLSEDTSLYQQLKSHCRGVAEELSWHRLVQGMLDSYECARHHVLRRSPV